MPDTLGSPFQRADTLHLRPAHAVFQRLGNQWPQPKDSIFHLRDTPLTDTVSRIAQFALQMPLGQLLQSPLLGKHPPGFEHRACFFDKGEVTPEIILPKMRQQDVRLSAPGPEQTGHQCIATLPGLLEQLLHYQQPGVAAGLNDIVDCPRALGDYQRLVQPLDPDRVTDAIVRRVGCMSRVVFVGLDPVYRQFQRLHLHGICPGDFRRGRLTIHQLLLSW